jgi:hypothetical protein
VLRRARASRRSSGPVPTEIELLNQEPVLAAGRDRNLLDETEFVVDPRAGLRFQRRPDRLQVDLGLIPSHGM